MNSQKFYIPPSIENRAIIFGLEKEEMVIIVLSLGSLMFVGGLIGIAIALCGLTLAKKLKDKKSQEQSYMARICYKYNIGEKQSLPKSWVKRVYG